MEQGARRTSQFLSDNYESIKNSENTRRLSETVSTGFENTKQGISSLVTNISQQESVRNISQKLKEGFESTKQKVSENEEVKKSVEFI